MLFTYVHSLLDVYNSVAQIIHFPINRYLGCSWSSVVWIDAAMNIPVYVFWSTGRFTWIIHLEVKFLNWRYVNVQLYSTKSNCFPKYYNLCY